MTGISAITTGLTCSKAKKTLGKAFAEGCPRQRPLGEFLDGKGGLCRGPFIGHSAKPLPRVKTGPRQRKAAVTAPTLLAVSLPRADPRQRNVFFLKKTLPRAFPRPSAKIYFIFFKKKTFAKGLIPGPRQRNVQDFLKKIFDEGYC